MAINNNTIRPIIEYNIEEARRRRQLQGQTRRKFPSRIDSSTQGRSSTTRSNESSFAFNGYRPDIESIFTENDNFDAIEFSFTTLNQSTRNVRTSYYPEKIKQEAQFREAQNIPDPKLRQIRYNNG